MKMSKIIRKKKWFPTEFSKQLKCLIFPVKNFSKNPDKEKDEQELDIEEKYKGRAGVLHDKQQSFQEESYFHKEEVEQLKELKKKVAQKKKSKDEGGNKN